MEPNFPYLLLRNCLHYIVQKRVLSTGTGFSECAPNAGFAGDSSVPSGEIVEHSPVLPLLPMMPCGGAIRDVMTGKRTAKAKNLRLKTASIKNTA